MIRQFTLKLKIKQLHAKYFINPVLDADNKRGCHPVAEKHKEALETYLEDISAKSRTNELIIISRAAYKSSCL